LAVLEQEEIRHVDDVRNRPYTEALEPPAEPERRRTHFHVEHRTRCVMGTALEIAVLDRHESRKLVAR
jgi:hypothetical protein